ncbi:MAG TPA: ATP-dependent DNA helicase UvrD2 [Mycobacteriales bacterium]|nr:ATP-dependent DNA helicase UvrD2 [Mycobacteriales bacterium]
MSLTVPAPGLARDVLAGLDDEQRAVALAVTGPVCVLAGAGTGKTRAITHRIAHGVVSGAYPAGQVLAVTFTARAAGEMRGRLRALGADGVQARTFHAAALRQLSYFWPRAFGGAMPGLVESKARLVAEAASRLRITPDRAAVRDLTSEVEWAKSTLLTPEAYAVGAAQANRGVVAGLELDDVARVYAEYEAARRRAEVLDFEELILLTVAAITEFGDIADELRSRYRHFVVDEYQDVTPLQHALLDAWLGGRDDICVVGDAAQTIYSFTGASPKWLLDFPRRFPHATVVRLVRDYRSTPQIVELANEVLAGAPATSAASAARVQLVGQRPPGPKPQVNGFASEPEEAADVVTRIRGLIAQGTPAREIAVLYRINAQSEVYEAALATAGIPYLIRGGERFFERPEVREAVVLLRGAARAADEGQPAALPAQVREALADRWKEDAPPPVGARAQRERWDSVAALVRLADDHHGDLASFVNDLEERAAAQHAPAVEGVTLASLHAAKGLEWDAVFLAGLVDGTLPLQHAQTAEEIEEERRLLYVGVTRAREHLFLSWAAARNEGGRASRRISRFLERMVPAPARASRPGSGPVGKPLSCRVCGRTLTAAAERRARRCQGCPSTYDEALFARLREWRATRAKELGQPAYCVFTDATLERIAEDQPTSVGALAGISGIGTAKLDKYGAEVLDLVKTHAEAQGRK